jgi:hypothetical protein
MTSRGSGASEAWSTRVYEDMLNTDVDVLSEFFDGPRNFDAETLRAFEDILRRAKDALERQDMDQCRRASVDVRRWARKAWQAELGSGGVPPGSSGRGRGDSQ